MVETELTVKSEQGLHARPADLFVRAANRFASEIQVCNLTNQSALVDAKSILKVLSLGVYNGHRILISAVGPDDQAAVDAIAALINSNFKEQDK